LRTTSKDKWVTVYFELLGLIEANLTPVSRVLFCYFDYDLHPNFQPQYKKLEVREYVGAPIIIPTARIRPETIDRQASVNGIDSLVRTNLIINQKKYIYIFDFSSKVLVLLLQHLFPNGIKMQKHVLMKCLQNRAVEY
jgi:hypothetical protein